MPELLNIQLRPDESEFLEAAAKRSRLTLVQWAKVALIKAATPVSTIARKDPPGSDAA